MVLKQGNCLTSYCVKKNTSLLFLSNLFVKGIFRHVCPHCKLKYRTERLLRIHIGREHPTADGGKCPVCQIVEFPTRKLLSQHIEVEHIKPTITEEYYEAVD